MGNTLGNKGAVAISLRIGRTKFLFANAHLAAHQNAVKQRNNDYSKIAKEMPLLLLKSEMKTKARLEFRINKANNANSVTRSKHSTSNAGDSIPTISTGQGFSMPYDDNSPRNDPGGLDDPAFVPELEDFANRVVFMGDLNYRVRGNRCVTLKMSMCLLTTLRISVIILLSFFCCVYFHASTCCLISLQNYHSLVCKKIEFLPSIHL